MRMARDRAWSQDIIAAAIDGELDWQISSTNSMPIALHHVYESPPSSLQALPQKFIDDPLSDQ